MIHGIIIVRKSHGRIKMIDLYVSAFSSSLQRFSLWQKGVPPEVRREKNERPAE
jgi:hypothetical protein